LEKAAKHGAQHGVKIKKMWDSADGYLRALAVNEGEREISSTFALN
jgi:hypothetical protein